jgi:hypothetical protein
MREARLRAWRQRLSLPSVACYGTRKLIFRELLRRKPFSWQRVEFLRCSRGTRHGALLYGRQPSLDNCLSGFVSTAAEAGAVVPP